MLDLIASITVILSEQKLIATTESGEQIVYTVSTGGPGHETPVMSTTIERMYEVATLTGPGYAIPDVPWIMCPVDNPEHCIHPNTTDTPLGEPASLGCVRMNEEDAAELFASVVPGTPFVVIDHVPESESETEGTDLSSGEDSPPETEGEADWLQGGEV